MVVSSFTQKPLKGLLVIHFFIIMASASPIEGYTHRLSISLVKHVRAPRTSSSLSLLAAWSGIPPVDSTTFEQSTSSADLSDAAARVPGRRASRGSTSLLLPVTPRNTDTRAAAAMDQGRVPRELAVDTRGTQQNEIVSSNLNHNYVVRGVPDEPSGKNLEEGDRLYR